MKQEYIIAVDNHELAKVRIALVNSLNSNPTGEEFKEMLTYAKNHLDDLFEENREAYYDVPAEDDWDTTFMDRVADDLEMNFSIEKLAFYQVVIEKVRKNDIETILSSRHNTMSAIDHPSKSKNLHAKTGIAVSTGGAILSIVGICKGITLLTIIGSAVLIGGVLICLTSSKRK